MGDAKSQNMNDAHAQDASCARFIRALPQCQAKHCAQLLLQLGCPGVEMPAVRLALACSESRSENVSRASHMHLEHQSFRNDVEASGPNCRAKGLVQHPESFKQQLVPRRTQSSAACAFDLALPAKRPATGPARRLRCHQDAAVDVEREALAHLLRGQEESFGRQLRARCRRRLLRLLSRRQCRPACCRWALIQLCQQLVALVQQVAGRLCHCALAAAPAGADGVVAQGAQLAQRLGRRQLPCLRGCQDGAARQAEKAASQPCCSPELSFCCIFHWVGQTKEQASPGRPYLRLPPPVAAHSSTPPVSLAFSCARPSTRRGSAWGAGGGCCGAGGTSARACSAGASVAGCTPFSCCLGLKSLKALDDALGSRVSDAMLCVKPSAGGSVDATATRQAGEQSGAAAGGHPLIAVRQCARAGESCTF